MTNSILMSLIKGLTLIFGGLLVVTVYLQTRNFGYAVFADKPYISNKQLMTEASVEIKENESIREIAEDLEAKGIIGNKLIFVLSMKTMEDVGDIKPGTYEVNSCQKPSEILKVITNKEEEP